MSKLAVVKDYRGSVCENEHAASAVICSKTGNLKQMFPGSEDARVYLRSAAKPFQAYAVLQSLSNPDLTPEEWAIICASHSASQAHLALVRQVLQKAGATVSDLQCGPHLPFDDAEMRSLVCAGEKPTPLHNNCSGKHAGMLLACAAQRWSKQTYLSLEHPLQQQILSIIKQFSATQDVMVAVDGCGAPVFCLPMPAIARLFSQLVQQPVFEPIVSAMLSHPEIVGDAQRIDTQLMKISNGRLVAKVGAEAFLGVANRQTGEGLALKVWDGVNGIRDRLVIALLANAGWLTEAEAEALAAQSAFSMVRTNTQGKDIGYYEIHLPWVRPDHGEFQEDWW